jgi:hypothetical protein
MKVLIGDIVVSKEVIGKMVNLEFSAKVAMKLMLLANECQKILDVYEKQRIALIKKFGENDEAGQTIVKANTNEYFEFINELNAVASQEVDLNYPELTEEDLTKDDNVKFSANDLLKMVPFFKKAEGKKDEPTDS